MVHISSILKDRRNGGAFVSVPLTKASTQTVELRDELNTGYGEPKPLEAIESFKGICKWPLTQTDGSLLFCCAPAVKKYCAKHTAIGVDTTVPESKAKQEWLKTPTRVRRPR